MRLYAVLFAIGAWILQREAALPDLRYAWLLALAVPVYALTRMRSRACRYTGGALLTAASLAAGFFWAAALAQARMSDALPREWEGRDIALVGVVAALPQPSDR